ncbi:MAG: hypothetical protein QOJ25_1011 [Solirubrobacteraceae bacterium]|jgi:hypothetical protein|nr:hypothetical protein [Solirubrobacteraceae bacterium]
MQSRIQIASIIFAALILVGVFELVRRRRLRERYALLWMAAALVLLVLAVWKHLLYIVAHAVGIAVPSNALFVIAFGFVLLLLLHFSVSVSRLGDQTRVLAQRLALLEERVSSGESSSEEDPDRDAERIRTG